MDKSTVNEQSNGEQHTTQHTDILEAKQSDVHLIKDANQNTAHPENLPQTPDNTNEQSAVDISESNDNNPSVVVDVKVSDENNQGIVDQVKEKGESFEVDTKNNLESVTSEDNKSCDQEYITNGDNVLEENIQDGNKSTNVLTSVKSLDTPSDSACKESEDEEAKFDVMSSEVCADNVVKVDQETNVEGNELELKSDNIKNDKDDTNTEKMDGKIEQINEQTSTLVSNGLPDETGSNTDMVIKEENHGQDTQSAEAAPELPKEGENVSSQPESAAQVTQEATAEVSSSIDENEGAADLHDQPIETSENKDEQTTTAPAEPYSTTWYTEEVENEDSKPEPGYSTTVVGGVVVRKPLSSSSSPEHKKPSPKNIRGSKFKVSWGSIFGRRKSTKDKPNGKQADTAMDEAQGHDGTDGVDDEQPTAKEEVGKIENIVAGEDKEKMNYETETSSPLENSLPEPSHPPNEGEEKIPHQGEIVPLDMGVAKADVEVAKKEPSMQEPEETQTDEDSILRERIAKRESWSPPHSPEKRMQMRVSYAEGSNTGEKEVEVIGTREVTQRPHPNTSNVPATCRYSCRELGDVDHEGWLAKRGGGAIFAMWKRKWVVLKERHLYYYKTSFDPEAGGVVCLDEKHTATAAPEIKRKFAFKIDSDTTKTHKVHFAADSKEDMDKWLTVLSAASRGQVIALRKTNLQVDDNVKMRKKSGSATKRAGSVLGIGGLYEYDGNLKKASPTRRRASFGSSPRENLQTLSLSVIASDGEEDQPRRSAKEPLSDETSKNDEEPTAEAAGQAEVETAKDAEGLSEPSREIPSTVESSQIDEVQSAPTEQPGSADAVDAVDAAEKTDIVTEEVSPTQQEPALESSPSEDDQPTIAPLEQVAAITDNTKKDENVTETREVSQSEVETEHVVQAHVTTPMVESKPETMEKQEVSQSQEKMEHVEAHATTPTSQNSRNSFSNTTWYLVLDAKDDVWVVPQNNDDELLSLVRTIKDARITITGTPLPGNEERGRAMTNVSSQNAEVLKLRELRRTLKDKESDVKAMDELLNQEVNRQSIHEWSARYPCLTEEISSEPLDDASDNNTNETTSQEQQNTDENIQNGETGEIKGEAIAKGEDTSEKDEERQDEKDEERQDEKDEERQDEKDEERQDEKEERREQDEQKEKEEPQQDNNVSSSAAEKKNSDDDVNKEKKESEGTEQEASKMKSEQLNVNSGQDKAEESGEKNETQNEESQKETLPAEQTSETLSDHVDELDTKF